MTTLRGKCSWFGGPEDTGVAPDEGLAFIYDIDMAPHLFLEHQPAGTTGLARRLNPDVFYVACRWDYDETSKQELLSLLTRVRAPSTGMQAVAHPADWGPHESTGRVADLSKGLMDYLGIETDDEVEVTFTPPGEQPMGYRQVAISSGHSTRCQGAVGPAPWGLNEVAEATRVVDHVATLLRAADVGVKVFHDTTSTSQSANLNAITSWHNNQAREIDVSCHFNAYQPTTSKPMGTEVLWVTQEELADEMSAAIAQAGSFIDRGPKYRDDLAFLNNTDKPAILLEVCFVDSKPDADLYRRNFEAICAAIVGVLSGRAIGTEPPEPVEPAPEPTPPVHTDVVAIDITVPHGVAMTIRVNGVDLLELEEAD